MTTTVLANIPSPAQGVWQLGSVPLRAYALFIIAGIIAALVIGDRRWEARGGEPGVIYDVAMWAVPFGLIGGRAYHVLTDWPTYFGADGAGFAAALRIWDGGLGIWGAVALGGIGAWIACRRAGVPLPAFGDAIAPGIVLAQAIGRLGNYFNQELYGRPTTLPWGLEIYERRNAAGALDSLNGVSNGQLLAVVHPTFLYELLWNLLIFVALILIDRRFRIGHGRLFAMYIAGYCLGRFWIELMRSDTATLLAGIRVNSFTATFVFIGAVVYIMAAPKGREDPETLRGRRDTDDQDDSAVEDLAKELAVAASTTGVVAAAKVAGEAAADDDQAEVVEAEDGQAEAEAEADESADAVEGVDSVEGIDDSVEDVDSVDEVAEAGDVDAVSEAEGLGSVSGDEVAAAVEGAAEVHEVAVDGEAEAAALVPEVEAEADAVAEESVDGAAEEASDDDAEDDQAEVAEAEDDQAEAEAEADESADAVEDVDSVDEVAEAGDVDAVSEAEGLGSVSGDEVAAAGEGAAEVHEVAVDGEAEAAALVPEVEAEADAVAEAEDAEADESADEAGSAEVDEATTAVDAAPSVDESVDDPEAESDDDAEAAPTAPHSDGEDAEPTGGGSAAKVEPKADVSENAAVESSPSGIDSEAGGRIRQWLRRRRSR